MSRNSMTSEKLFVALVDYLKGDDPYGETPEEAIGAAGYMAVRAETMARAVEHLRAELGEMGYEVVSVEDMAEVGGAGDVEHMDAHLARNMRRWEPGRRTVWGTIHAYDRE